MNKISIVIPVYNSSDCLEELDKRISMVLENYELILVNDGSADNSWEIIRQITSKNKKVIGINLMKNSGQDNAIMAGLSQVTGEYVVIMDDDLQHDPADIPSLYNAIQGGYDVCYANFKSKKQALWKNFGSRFNGWVADKIISKPPHLYLSPFKIMSRRIADEITTYSGPYPYIDGLIFRITSSITQVDAEHHDRFSGKSNYNLIRSVRVFLKLATSFSVTPLRISSMVGFFTSNLAVLLALYYLAEYFISGTSIPGWTSLILLVLFFGPYSTFPGVARRVHRKNIYVH